MEIPKMREEVAALISHPFNVHTREEYLALESDRDREFFDKEFGETTYVAEQVAGFENKLGVEIDLSNKDACEILKRIRKTVEDMVEVGYVDRDGTPMELSGYGMRGEFEKYAELLCRIAYNVGYYGDNVHKSAPLNDPLWSQVFQIETIRKMRDVELKLDKLIEGDEDE